MKTNNMLNPQELFLRSHKKHHRFVHFVRILICLLFLLLWELLADLKLIDTFFFSSPTRILACIGEMIIKKNLFMHIGITLLEAIISFILVMFFSITIATLLWSSKSLSEITEPYLVLLNSLPKSALAPLFIVWFGTGFKTIVIAGISVAVFGSIISLYTAFIGSDPDKITLVYTLGGSKWDTFFKVVLPSNVPTILSNMKVNIGLSLVGVIIGEFLAARRGLGYLIIYGSQVFQMNMVISSILILCLIAVLLYLLIAYLDHHYKKKTGMK